MSSLRPTSLARGYGIQQLPGPRVEDQFLANPHGGLRERSEGFGQYAPRWGTQSNAFGYYDPLNRRVVPMNAGQGSMPAPRHAIEAMPNAGVYYRRDFDQAAVLAQQYESLGGGMDGGAVRGAIGPMPQPYHPDQVGGQSAASRIRLNQRYGGVPGYSAMRDTRTDMGVAQGPLPSEDFDYSTFTRGSDAYVSQEQQQMLREAAAVGVVGSPYHPGNRARYGLFRPAAATRGLPERTRLGFRLSNDPPSHQGGGEDSCMALLIDAYSQVTLYRMLTFMTSGVALAALLALAVVLLR